MSSTTSFNNQIKQVMILFLLLLLIFLSIKELYIFFPGLLGALTFYILSRSTYFQLIYHRKWKKGWTAGLYLLVYFLLLVLLVYVIVILLEKQVRPFFNDPAAALGSAKQAINEAQEKAGFTFISDETLSNLQQKLSEFVPMLVNSTSNLVVNLALLLFVLYYMLVHGKEMESYLGRVIPLKQTNIDLFASETKRIVKASALGIPIISIIQGLTATAGYIIFDVNEFVLWGFLTGIFAFFPVVGTMIIWVPLVIYMYASGNTWNATGLLLFSVIVTGNVDYLARITLLKKLGNIHPMVTVLGVIVGLGLFGFIGLIFGPLLVNYIILLFRIYTNEFIDHKTPG
ncbi:MAG: AI-2E family transporter [Chitinophagaceae bacterium]|nr:AI-2E family transporter [Chitinophagaceae bacterium]